MFNQSITLFAHKHNRKTYMQIRWAGQQGSISQLR